MQWRVIERSRGSRGLWSGDKSRSWFLQAFARTTIQNHSAEFNALPEKLCQYNYFMTTPWISRLIHLCFLIFLIRAIYSDRLSPKHVYITRFLVVLWNQGCYFEFNLYQKSLKPFNRDFIHPHSKPANLQESPMTEEGWIGLFENSNAVLNLRCHSFCAIS